MLGGPDLGRSVVVHIAREAKMALARAVTFEGVDRDRMAELSKR